MIIDFYFWLTNNYKLNTKYTKYIKYTKMEGAKLIEKYTYQVITEEDIYTYINTTFNLNKKQKDLLQKYDSIRIDDPDDSGYIEDIKIIDKNTKTFFYKIYDEDLENYDDDDDGFVDEAEAESEFSDDCDF